MIVDGVSVHGKHISDVKSMIMGPEGTSILVGKVLVCMWVFVEHAHKHARVY
jgi:hypothetical protein